MTAKKPIDEQIVDFLQEKGSGTVDQIAAAVGVGRTSARKYLAGLTTDGKVNREASGRVGRRRLPDVYSLRAKKRGDRPKKAAWAASKNGRLGPGELDNVVSRMGNEPRDYIAPCSAPNGRMMRRAVARRKPRRSSACGPAG
jgi:DNA-binding Lrp family transcriptional regulator